MIKKILSGLMPLRTRPPKHFDSLDEMRHHLQPYDAMGGEMPGLHRPVVTRPLRQQ